VPKGATASWSSRALRPKCHTSKCDKHASCHTSQIKISRLYRPCHTCEGYLPPRGGESFPPPRPVATCHGPLSRPVGTCRDLSFFPRLCIQHPVTSNKYLVTSF